ncbi:MAG: cupin domain-containing protein [Promethearchaeota archaeon]
MKNAADESIIGKVLKVVDLVNYQKGAVVSRAIIQKEVGSIALFAFDEGQGLSEHSAPYDALVHVLEGRVEIKISGESFRLKEGEMIIMPKNEPHALTAISKFKMMLTMIKQ